MNVIIELVERWAERAEPLGLLAQDRTARLAQLAAWIPLMIRAEAGDVDAEEEVAGLLALEARSQGVIGRPPSPLARTLWLLADVARQADRPLDRAIERGLMVAMDAYGLGVSDAARMRVDELLRDYSPVYLLDGVPVGHLIGPVTSGNVDALLGRLVRTVEAQGAARWVLDLTAAEASEPVLADAIADAMRLLGARRRVELVVVGMRRESLREVLRARGVEIGWAETLEAGLGRTSLG